IKISDLLIREATLIEPHPTSPRLGLQRLLWQLHTKHLLHPGIPIKDGMEIADIGAGTGIWATELATQLPPSARVTAYDITDTHFPAPEYWPSNLKFEKLDSLGAPSPSLVCQFDVVHLRMWAFNIRDNDPGQLIRNAAKLLKPGGYLQWEDARFGRNVVRGDAVLEVRQVMQRMSNASKHNFQWLDQLDLHVKRAEGALDVIDCQYKPWSTQSIPLCMDTFMVALESSGAALDCLKQVDPSAPTLDEWENALEALHNESRHPGGSQLYWLPVTLLARKK
ncbi:hypothetical protein ABOM_005619, partial [Aspergillus bombycis]